MGDGINYLSHLRRHHEARLRPLQRPRRAAPPPPSTTTVGPSQRVHTNTNTHAHAQAHSRSRSHPRRHRSDRLPPGITFGFSWAQRQPVPAATAGNRRRYLSVLQENLAPLPAPETSRRHATLEKMLAADWTGVRKEMQRRRLERQASSRACRVELELPLVKSTMSDKIINHTQS
ncbi:uncharacterized protein EHS24_000848 [Apiotrichum porosum]|uniref:Uncharacterized protein n=1 Tax=Apiotrichum porosum TaxID=105984 RepID=A0A427YB25_9TREE|nr:uncharacterized protein EHS24_000848 [Apiotrichum porosum]RSH88312.1 hypothetical protein EHS24_000848 [Apiotrichum porosum]